jgi:hypothetical protein
MYVYILCYIDIILFVSSGKTTIPLARYRYDADELGGDDASVDRSDEEISTDDSGDENDVDLFSNIAVDEESEYGIDTYDKASTKWQVFGVRDRLANSPLEITSMRRGRPSKVDNLVHGLSDALTRFLNVMKSNKEAAA